MDSSALKITSHLEDFAFGVLLFAAELAIWLAPWRVSVSAVVSTCAAHPLQVRSCIECR